MGLCCCSLAGAGCNSCPKNNFAVNTNKPSVKAIITQIYNCPNCDEILLESDDFCSHCGVKIDWSEIRQNNKN